MGDSDKLEIRNAKLGETIEISLESYPGSGAIWYCAEADPDRLELVEELRVNLSENVGGAVRQSFRFRARKTGDSRLRFELKRTWEKTVRREKAVLLHVE